MIVSWAFSGTVPRRCFDRAEKEKKDKSATPWKKRENPGKDKKDKKEG